MFKKWFSKKNKKKENDRPEVDIPNRDIFEELFPLSKENKQAIEKQLNQIQIRMFGEEGFNELKNYKRTYQSQLDSFGRLTFETFGWEKIEETEIRVVFANEYGDTMVVTTDKPNGFLTKENPSDINVYRSFLRNIVAPDGGGIILAEHLSNEIEVDGIETITKMSRADTTGIDYTYQYNIHSYEEQLLYLIYITIKEMSPTGIRDNNFMHPICTVTGLNIMQIFHLYRKDPYDKNFKEGNVMNISERQEFDYLFPFHPLTILRQDIIEPLKANTKFD